MPLQPNENLNGDHNQNELQNPTSTLDNQSKAQTVDSNAILAPIGLGREQDPQHLTQDPSILSTNDTTITQPQTQSTASRTHDPSTQPEYDTSTSSPTSQQSSSSNNNINSI